MNIFNYKHIILLSALMVSTQYIVDKKEEVFTLFSILTVQLMPLDTIVSACMVLFFISYIYVVSFIFNRFMTFRSHDIIKYTKLLILSLILLASEYMLLSTTLTHKGLLHGWEVHIIGEKQYLVFALLTVANIIGVMLYHDEDYRRSRQWDY